MILTIDRVVNCGTGSAPQCVHDPNGKLRIIYLSSDGHAHCRECVPALGLYDTLTFKEIGIISPDEDISLPCIKKVQHEGAFGFWSAEDDHRFIIYMMPTDISKSFTDGSVNFTATSEISSFSGKFINIRGELINRRRALIAPGTKLELYFSIGDSGETPLGVYYVDRASISYPDCELSVSARNAVGKLLKEQTFDENSTVDEGSLHDNVEAILEFAGIDSYFVGDVVASSDPLVFKPSTTLQEGINYAINLTRNWKLRETLDGVVGVAPITDPRFDRPMVYTFERDKTCWSYSIEFDDSDAASRICVYSEGVNQEDPTVSVYVNVTFNKWWQQPVHRTTHVKTVNGATVQQVTAIAEELAEVMQTSGRVETFAGLFTPQLTIADEVHLIDEQGRTEIIGAVTDVKHSFGKDGFYTSFTVDSGGRRGKSRLKDLIDAAASDPESFTGVQHETADGDSEEY